MGAHHDDAGDDNMLRTKPPEYHHATEMPTGECKSGCRETKEIEERTPRRWKIAEKERVVMLLLEELLPLLTYL